MSWVLVLLADSIYMKLAFWTIQMARTNGEWTHDIVLMCPEGLQEYSPWKELGEQFQVQFRPIPPRDQKNIWSAWEAAKDHPGYPYLLFRPNIFYKFYIVDTFFKQWDVVFYVDSGCRIQGSLERFQNVATPQDCLYALSDAHPTYDKVLSNEFALDLLSPGAKEEIETQYILEKDYFQTTVLLYDTKILKDGMVDRLFYLAGKYRPKSDQGIFNLLFQFEVPSWKPIPLRDDQGWLYDFHEREDYKQEEYCILKVPISEMNVKR